MNYTEVQKTDFIQVPTPGDGNVEETYAVFYPQDGYLCGGYLSAEEVLARGDAVLLGRGMRIVKVTIEAL